MDWLNFDPGPLHDQFVGLVVGFVGLLLDLSLRIPHVFP